MTTTLPAFPTERDAAFVSELKQRVNAYFDDSGIDPYANPAMVAKTVVLLTTFGGVYGLLLTGWFGPWAMLGLVVVLAVTLAGIGFSIVHDALHGAYARKPWINRLLGLTSELLGIHGYQWKLTHNKSHHVYTNVLALDGDITHDALRLTPRAEWRPLHRAQHVYAWPLYAMITLYFAYAKDYVNIAARRIGPLHDIRHPRGAYAGLVIGKTFHYSLTIVTPLLVLDLAWWRLLIGLLAFYSISGLILGTVFMLAHVFESTAYPEPGPDGRWEDGWHVHQLRTTADFARSNRLLTCYLGGLNYQVEHHLFPGLCSVHYPAISPIVERTAHEHGLPYNAVGTVRAALAAHQCLLRRLGRRPRMSSALGAGA